MSAFAPFAWPFVALCTLGVVVWFLRWPLKPALLALVQKQVEAHGRTLDQHKAAISAVGDEVGALRDEVKALQAKVDRNELSKLRVG